MQLELPLAEELGVPELARLAPVRAVGRPEHVGVVVEQVPANVEPRPVDKRLVVALEEHPGGVGGGADNDADRAHPDGHQRAIPQGELEEGAVSKRAEQVQAPDDRPRPRAWRETILAVLPESQDRRYENHGGESNGKEGEFHWQLPCVCCCANEYLPEVYIYKGKKFFIVIFI